MCSRRDRHNKGIFGNHRLRFITVEVAFRGQGSSVAACVPDNQLGWPFTSFASLEHLGGFPYFSWKYYRID